MAANCDKAQKDKLLIGIKLDSLSKTEITVYTSRQNKLTCKNMQQ